ncbi:MAG TPA: hypothetical protein VN661_03250 [Candidatus Acidoferrales bacterium]|nr:hypothetical protein [Candidatus Acidoferrales bacterium]
MSRQSAGTQGAASFELRVQSANFKGQSAAVVDPSTHKPVRVKQGEKVGTWTLMAVVQNAQGNLAVFENLKDEKGSIVYAGAHGVVLTLPKSLEPTSVPAGTQFCGHSLDELEHAKTDLAAQPFLAAKTDPTLDQVAACMPPLRVPSFVGTTHSVDKPTWDYAGFSDEIYVDVGKLFTEIQDARNRHDVGEGLVGGWLPVNRFVFPAGDQRYWEEVIFADEAPGHFWTQPTWFRVLLVDHGELKEAHYYYHHLPFPPRGEPSASLFYAALQQVHSVWQRDMNPSMKIDVPDPRILDFCLHAMILERITRAGAHPHYGYPPLGGINVFGGYGYANVDTFQDTFNTSVAVFLDWGMFDVARSYIDDYFTHSVRDDGSIDTRGPEIGQYGKMLTELAQYYDYTHDAQLLRKHQKKIEAIVNLFYTLRKESKQRPSTDISYGIIRGWAEHDSSLKVHPYRFMQPHFSNNAEAARGFHDLGGAWIEMGRAISDAHLQSEGRAMLAESDAMKKDMETAIAKSIDRTKNPPYMPAVAGDTPTYGKQRVYEEMLESGELTEDQDKIIDDYADANGGSFLGLPRFGDHLGGFLDFGPAYALIQHDWIRRFVLFYDAAMSHIYSPGTWTAVESARMGGTLGGPYCTPSEVLIPTFTKWMLVFEDPDRPIVWLARATPDSWLAQGKRISVSGAPTRFGRVGYELHSDIDHGKISAVLHLPQGYRAITKLRLRVPGERKISGVTVNGAKWTDFSAEDQSVTIPARSGEVRVEVSY